MKSHIKELVWKIPLAAALSAGAMYGIVKAKPRIENFIQNKMWKFQQEKKFGTVENPAYQITEKIEKPAVFLDFENSGYYSDEKISLENELSECYTLMNKIWSEDKAEIAEKALALKKNVESVDAERLYSELKAASARFENECNRARILVQKIDPDSEYEARKKATFSEYDGRVRNPDLDPSSVMKEIFRGMTKREFPSCISILHEKQLSDRAGYHDTLKSLISAEDLQSAGELETLLHEAGHVCAQHQEANLSARPYGSDHDITVLEEACAYAFTDAGANWLAGSNPKLAFIVKSIFEFKAGASAYEHHWGEPDDQWLHNEATALFLAARAVLKDPALVYNTLATVKDSKVSNLPIEILAELENAGARARKRDNNWMLVSRDVDDLKKEYDELIRGAVLPYLAIEFDKRSKK